MRTELSDIRASLQLSDALETLENGSRPKGGIKEIGQGIPSLGGEHLDGDGGFKLETVGLIPEGFYRRLTRGKIKKGDVLLVKDGATTGKVSIVRDDFPFKVAAVNEHIFILRGKKDVVDQRFLYYHLQSQWGQRQISASFHGAAIGGINTQFAKKYTVLLPPLSRQKEIAETLDQVRATRILRVQADETTESILSAVFYSVFRAYLDDTPSHIELEKRSLRITDGEHITPRRVSKGIYLLSARNVLNHEITLTDVDYIDEDEYERISRRIKPQTGDILISCSGSVGRVARVKGDLRFQMVRSVALVRPDLNKLIPEYLEYLLTSDYLQRQIASQINQSSQGNLFQGKIKKLKICIPPKDLQIRFASTVRKMESLKELQKQSTDASDELYMSLVQQYMGDERIR